MLIDVNQAASLLREGKLVAIPTDTVYGLAASLDSEEAQQSLYRIKERPRHKPFITQVASVQELLPFVSALPKEFEALSQAFWPGPLTLVVPGKDSSETRAFRIPRHRMTLDLLQLTGPLAVPSANPSGRPSATLPSHVESDFGADFPVLDGGACEGGVESSILAYCSGTWQLLRQGAVLPEELEPHLGYRPELVTTVQNETAQPSDPSVVLLLQRRPYDGSIPRVLGFSDRAYPGAQSVVFMGELINPVNLQQGFYRALREVQEQGYGEIWVDGDFCFEGSLAPIAARLKAHCIER